MLGKEGSDWGLQRSQRLRSNLAFVRPVSLSLRERDANPETRKIDSYPAFDWLRILLASIVALSHEGVPSIGPVDGNLAVLVFLALSGWLIGGILLRTSTEELPRFFFNRATRIWIPYAFTVVVIYGLAALRDGVDLHWFKYLFYDVTFTHVTFTEFPRALSELPLGGTGNHFWSISVEEQFYLAAPLLMLLLPFGKKLWTWVVVSLVLMTMGSIFSPIALGVLAALIARDFPGWNEALEVRLLIWTGVVVTLSLCFLSNTVPMRSLFSILLVQGLAFPGKRGRIGTFFGAISYPFYLNHWMGMFVVNFVQKHTHPFPHAWITASAYSVALVAGVLTWALIDRWVMQVRNGWYSRGKGVSLGALAYILLSAGLVGGTIVRAHGG